VLFPLAAPDEKLPILAGVPAGERARPVLSFLEGLAGAQPWVETLYKLKLDPDLVLFLRDGAQVHWGELPADPGVLRAKALRLQRVLQDDALKPGAEYIRFVDDKRIAVKVKN
jgi:hypothetical protein